MDTQQYRHALDMPAHPKPGCDPLAQAETNPNPLLNGLLHLPSERATPITHGSTARTGDEYIKRLIGGR